LQAFILLTLQAFKLLTLKAFVAGSPSEGEPPRRSDGFLVWWGI